MSISTTQRVYFVLAVIGLFGLAWSTACGGKSQPATGAGSGPASEIEPACDGGTVAPDIAGTYKDNFGNSQDIGDKVWTTAGESGSSTFTYCVVENADGRLTAQNGSNNPYYPNLFSAFYWTKTDDGKLWFCQQVFDAESAEGALNAPPPDSSNPSQGGCGIPQNNFPWSELIPTE